MAIRTSTQTTVLKADGFGGVFTSADAGTAQFTVVRALGGTVVISIHAGGQMYAAKGDSVTCNGTYSYSEVAL